MEDADTARITFEVVNVRPVKRGVWLAQHGDAGGSIYDIDVSDEEFFV